MARSRWGVALALSAAFGALGAATCYRAPTEDDRVACRAAAARIEAAVDRARVADGCVQPFQNSLAVIPFAEARGTLRS